MLDLGVQPTSYTIVIPSTVTLDPATGEGSPDITLKSGFVLTDISSLKVRATGGYVEGAFSQGQYGGANTTSYAHMMLTNSEKNASLTCKIYAGDLLKKTTDLIGVTNKTDNTSDVSKTLRFKVTSSLPSYGRYTGTLTFSVITE